MNRKRRVGLVAGMTVVTTLLALLYPLIGRGAGWLEVECAAAGARCGLGADAWASAGLWVAPPCEAAG